MTDSNDDIKINDKRRFKMSDDNIEENTSISEEQNKKETSNDTTGYDSEINTSTEDSIQNPNYKITFIDLINSLAGTTLIQLGAIADPQTNVIKKDLNAAKQTIDILEILKEKTAGNLNNEESMMLDNVLFDLRMRYVLMSESKK
ncbi:MAG: DUF1844 domain-containing protein [bacterium]